MYYALLYLFMIIYKLWIQISLVGKVFCRLMIMNNHQEQML